MIRIFFQFCTFLYFLICFLQCQGAEECAVSDFSCHNGNCVSMFLKCNGNDDCGDYSDEISCDIVKHAKPGQKLICNRVDFMCHNQEECIPGSWVCDGQPDCIDKSDETTNCHRENCTGYSCLSSKECIPARWRCDKWHDCKDKSDEMGCTHIDDRCKIEDGRFMCNDGLCLPSGSVCNNITDCIEGEDEGGLCSSGSNSCQELRCAHKCMSTPKGPKCFCSLGYKLDENDRKSCRDIDECVTLKGICSQNCNNTHGGYFCSCISGYQLLSDKTTCKVKGVAPTLLITTPNSIEELNLGTNQLKELFYTSDEIQTISYHGSSQSMFWYERNENNRYIKSKKLAAGSNQKVLMQKGLDGMEDLDIDWLNGKMYMVESYNKRVFACDLDGANCVDVVVNLQSSSLFLHPISRLMFWSAYNDDHNAIYEGYMDGSEQKVLVSLADSWPHGLFYDDVSDHLFWTNIKSRTVSSYGRVEMTTQILVQQEEYFPYSIAVFEVKLYWSDLNLDSVLSCNKFTGRNIEVVKKGSSKPLNLLSVHPILYEHSEPNPCLDSKCTHSCLISKGSSFKCMCPSGFVLANDRYTCLSSGGKEFVMVMFSPSQFWKIFPQAVGQDVIEERQAQVYSKSTGAIIYDGLFNVFYISDLEEDVIFSLSYNGTKRIIVDSHIDTVKGLALDTYGRNLYWTDIVLGTIQVVSLDGINRKVIYENINRPSDIVLNLNKGVGYVLQESFSPKILEISLVGSTPPKELISDNLRRPASLLLHPPFLFWADRDTFAIEMYDYTSESRKIFLDHISSPLSLSATNNAIYWVNDLNQIRSATLKGKMNFESNFIGAENIDVTPRLVSAVYQVQEVAERRCHKNGSSVCDHLCLQDIDDIMCSCSLGYELHDNYTCKEKLCSNKEFLCQLSRSCIPKKWRCDGTNDCIHFNPKDLSDEDDCFRCLEDEFTCLESGKCIHNSWKCDGLNDCHNGSDEHSNTCNNETSLCNGMFSCGQGQCVNLNWVCDQEPDCINGADELDCDTPKCSTQFQFECQPGNCIPKHWKCDGVSDCDNDTDETDCAESTSRACSKYEFTCSNGFCIEKSMICDRDLDCPDGSDESSQLCDSKEHISCGNDQWKCTESEKCIQKNQLCNHVADCDFAEDEHGCSDADKILMEELLNVQCSGDQWNCPESNTCIPSSHRCDRILNCLHGEDETNCTVEEKVLQHVVSCIPGKEFQCSLDSCIPSKWLCDGIPDCPDGSDENGMLCHRTVPALPSTTPPPCPHGQFQCLSSGECLHNHKFCDGHPDCIDFSDEGSKCGFCSHNNGGCSHVCSSSYYGPVCSCPPGLKLVHGKICQDINECEEWGQCSQMCTNTKGSFKCNCYPNYKLGPDQRTCKAINDAGLSLLLGFSNQIRSLTPDGFHFHMLIEENKTRISDFSYDQRRSILYYIESFNGNIRYRKQQERNIQEITLKEPAKFVSADWLTGSIYYVDKRNIRACDVDTPQMCVTVIRNMYQEVKSFTVAANEGVMFWTVWATKDQKHAAGIWRSVLDGTEKQVIIVRKLVKPTSIVVDPTTQRLFWCDTELNLIESTDLLGHNRKRILGHVDFGNPVSIAIFQDTIYWISKTFGLLMAGNKFSNEGSFSINQLAEDYHVLKISHPFIQPGGMNPCSWKSTSCPHMCLLRKSSYSCLCKDGFLHVDHNVCHDPTIGPNLTKVSSSGSLINNQRSADSCDDLKCGIGGECVVVGSQAQCSCSSGFQGDACEESLVSAAESNVDTMSIGFGVGVSFSVALVIILAYNSRRRIRDFIRKKRSKELAILFSNNSFSDTERLHNLPKSNNRKITAAQMARNMPSKQLLSFNNPLCEAQPQEVYVERDDISADNLRIFETDENAHLMRNDVQFHIWPSSESLSM